MLLSSNLTGVFSAYLFPDELGHHAPAIRFQHGFSVDPPEQVEQGGDKTCPARLVTGPEAGAVVTVKVFVKQDQVAPVRIVLEFFRSPVNRPFAMRIAQERASEASLDLVSHFEERHVLPGPCRTFDL